MLENEAGSVPVSEFSITLSTTSDESWPNDSGSVPARLPLLSRLRSEMVSTGGHTAQKEQRRRGSPEGGPEGIVLPPRCGATLAGTQTERDRPTGSQQGARTVW